MSIPLESLDSELASYPREGMPLPLVEGVTTMLRVMPQPTPGERP